MDERNDRDSHHICSVPDNDVRHIHYEESVNDEVREKKMALLENQAKILMASFDSVQIFCTKYEGEDTANYVYGGGNFMARYGHVRAWLLHQDSAEAGLLER